MTSEEIIQNEELETAYNDYAAECRAALRLALARIQNLEEAVDRAGLRNPFDDIESRIKTFESVKNKCKARGYDLDIDSIKENIKDIAGIRIIVEYSDDIDVVRDMLLSTQHLNVVSVKDYVKNPKASGYSGMHIACQIEITVLGGGSRLTPVEIQIRTWAMDLWAKYEHKFKYKNPCPPANVDRDFAEAAKFVRNFDEKIIELRNDSAAAINEKILAESDEIEVKEI